MFASRPKAQDLNANRAIENPPAEAALKFMNDYVDYCNRLDTISIVGWVSARTDATQELKNDLKWLMNELWANDPENGLGIDPVLDAQDYPDAGFKLDSYDPTTGFAIVSGTNWDDFKLTLKLLHQNDRWFVDGVGCVRIPVENRMWR